MPKLVKRMKKPPLSGWLVGQVALASDPPCGGEMRPI
jgi:hypothetical protein